MEGRSREGGVAVASASLIAAILLCQCGVAGIMLSSYCTLVIAHTRNIKSLISIGYQAFVVYWPNSESAAAGAHIREKSEVT